MFGTAETPRRPGVINEPFGPGLKPPPTLECEKKYDFLMSGKLFENYHSLKMIANETKQARIVSVQYLPKRTIAKRHIGKQACY